MTIGFTPDYTLKCENIKREVKESDLNEDKEYRIITKNSPMELTKGKIFKAGNEIFEVSHVCITSFMLCYLIKIVHHQIFHRFLTLYGNPINKKSFTFLLLQHSSFFFQSGSYFK